MKDDIITPIYVDDLDDIACIHAACFDDPWTPPMLRRILAMPGSFGLSAKGESRGLIFGFALGRVAVDECELLSLGVAPTHRGCGLGARLLDAAMARASAANVRRFFLEVAQNNAPALQLYASRGLTTVGRRPDYYELKGGGYADALTMSCDLPPLEPARD